jgi:hypothetical protein
MEGVLGYDNAIVLTQPIHIGDLKYLRDPSYAYGPWLSVGTVSRNGRFVDKPVIRITDPTATPSTSLRRRGAATRSRADSRRSWATWPAALLRP